VQRSVILLHSKKRIYADCGYKRNKAFVPPSKILKGGNNMVKRIVSVLMAVILIALILAGCGAERSTKSQAVTGNEMAVAEVKGDAGWSDSNLDAAPAESEAAEAAAENSAAKATALTGSGQASQSVSNAILSQRKIIRNANLTIEVDSFDEAYSKINSFILGIGYISQSNVTTERVFVDSVQKPVKSGVIVLRVDKDKFDRVLSDVKGLGDVLSESMNTDDVTEKYFDVDSRLRLLRYEESRLEEYLRKVSDPDTIFKTESRLTDIRHEIEGLTGTLKKLDDLVELSTITINLKEKMPEGAKWGTTRSYGNRLADSFKDSVEGVVRFCGDLLILIVQILPVIFLLGLFALAVLAVYRRVGKNLKLPKNKDDDKGI